MPFPARFLGKIGGLLKCSSVMAAGGLRQRQPDLNPAFEVLTGYSREEAIGETPRLLKSGQQTPELYQELWATILSGNVFRGVLANRKKSGEIFYAEKSITPVRDSNDKITHYTILTIC
jgi:PAS domain S-box-containing protein